jgi:hypothetical protein
VAAVSARTERDSVSCAGRSIIEIIWEDLDDVMDRLMAEPTDADKGEALGLARALATMMNPYEKNVDSIRGEAFERWQEREERRSRKTSSAVVELTQGTTDQEVHA